MFSEADRKVLQTALIAGGIALLGLIYYIWASVNPEITQLDKAMSGYQEDLKKKHAELEQVKKWEARAGEIAAIVQQLEQKVQRVPKTAEPGEFFRLLRECVRRTNMTDIKIARLKNVPMGAYDEIPYTITCRARYHDLGQFLTLVEQHPQQIMRVKTLDVSNDAKRPSRHSVIVQLATFVFTQPFPKEVASK